MYDRHLRGTNRTGDHATDIEARNPRGGYEHPSRCGCCIGVLPAGRYVSRPGEHAERLFQHLFVGRLDFELFFELCLFAFCEFERGFTRATTARLRHSTRDLDSEAFWREFPDLLVEPGERDRCFRERAASPSYPLDALKIPSQGGAAFPEGAELVLQRVPGRFERTEFAVATYRCFVASETLVIGT